MGIANEKETTGINREEVKRALKNMKNGKATGPDEIQVEVWKCLGDKGIDILLELISTLSGIQYRMPDEWGDSVTVPI
jgi:hypothetical protein